MLIGAHGGAMAHHAGSGVAHALDGSRPAPQEIRILLIDENAADRRRRASMLRELLPGADILEAGTGLEYAQYLACGVPHVAISAERLSFGEGVRVLEVVKRRYPDSLTVLISDVQHGGASTPDRRIGTGAEGWHELSRLALATCSIDPEARRGVRSPIGPCAESLAVDEGGAARRVPGTSCSAALAGIRTELLSVYEHADRLADSMSMDPCARRELGCVVHGSERLLAALEYALEVPCEDHRRSPEPVCLGDAALDAMRTLQPALVASGARVQSGTLPTLLADRREMVALFYNLIDNAITFTGTAPPLVTIRAGLHAGAWIISVQDNGPGVAPHETAVIFDMFARGALAEGRCGAGIGLALCRDIARRYAGDVTVESTPGAGSTFLVSLYASAVEPEAVDFAVHLNGKRAGRVRVVHRASKAELTRAALAIPALSEMLGDLTIKDVQLSEQGVVNIVA